MCLAAQKPCSKVASTVEHYSKGSNISEIFQLQYPSILCQLRTRLEIPTKPLKGNVQVNVKQLTEAEEHAGQLIIQRAQRPEQIGK